MRGRSKHRWDAFCAAADDLERAIITYGRDAEYIREAAIDVCRLGEFPESWWPSVVSDLASRHLYRGYAL